MTNDRGLPSRRGVLTVSLASFAAALFARRTAAAAPLEIKVRDEVPVERWDFATRALDGWTVVSGRWAVEGTPGAASGKPLLVQRAVDNEFNVIVAPSGPYSDTDVSVKFRPISGRDDASGGLVFRFSDGKYYVIRANALEDNVRFYSYDRGRRMLASASVKAPALGQWHSLRAVMVGDRVQGWLDGRLLLDHRDTRFRTGRVGLWTKADSVTAFDDFTIRGVPAGG